MRDTSDFTDGTEQAKPVSSRPRTPARSKPEGTVPGNQEQETRPATRQGTASSNQDQETRPATRRRTPANTQGTTRHHNGNEGSPAASPSAGHTRPAQNQQHSAPGGQRGGGNYGQRTNSSYSTQQRTAGTGAQAQQRTIANNTAAPAAPPARSAPSQQRPGGTGGQRSTHAPQQQRHPGAGSSVPQQGTHSSGSQGYGQRSSGSGAPTRSGGSGRSGAPTRPGSSGRPGAPTRSGGSGRSGTATRSGGPGQRSAERRAAAVKEKPTGPVSIPPQIVVKDLADLLQTTSNEVIRNLIKHSIFANINQVVEYEKAALVAQDLGFEPSQTAATDSPAVQGERALSASEANSLTARSDEQTIVVPPVVTIMGHVDHGKTSLLDTIRKTKVAAGEAGGITQHIGAYQVEVNGKKITFLDTPGHEAFTAMRARGAQVAHIAIIVVAADDGVMPQTREAIDHARAAKMPIIIALNKIDRPNANPDHVKQQLADIGVVVEEYGGDIVCVPISAKKNIGIDDLLDYIILVAELQDIRANPNRPATGVIIEAKLEKNSGPAATVLVQQGTLKMGDNILVGAIAGKVRAMFNDRGKRIQKASPSTPVSIMGLPEVPEAGDQLEVVHDERTAKQRAQQEAEKRRNESVPLGQVSLDTLYTQMQEGKVKELNVVLKCDVQGSAEAIKNALSKITEENMKVRLIRDGIGNISETDVHLGAASGAIVIGFNVKADGAAQREAEKEGVEIRYYDVIYKLIDDIQAALAGMLEPTFREVIEGHAEVAQIFKAGKTLIAGCRVTDGKITRSSQARVMRNGSKVYDGKIASLRRGKDDVREVLSGYECGILLEDFNEVEAGDIIEAFSQERVKPGA